MSEALRFEDVTFRFDRRGAPVLGSDARLALAEERGSVAVPAGIHLDVESGTVTAILGPNGAGKTTLLHLALGWLRPENGRVLVDGRPLTSRSRRDLGMTIALVPQIERTPFALSVLDYVLLGRAPHLAPLAMPSTRDERIATEAIDEVGLADLRKRPLTTLSGGERQRAMLARAFAQDPRILLMDEPTAHLDVGHKAALAAVLRRRVANGLTVLLTTHEPDVAAALASRLVLMRGGQIRRMGPVPEVFNAIDLSATYGVPIRIGEIDGKQVAMWS